MATGVANSLKIKGYQSWFYLVVSFGACSIVFFGNISNDISRRMTFRKPLLNRTNHLVRPNVTNPWRDVPDFIFYLRFTSGERPEYEYRNVFLRSLRIFVPAEQSKVLVVLDGEKKKDRVLGKRLKNQWPYPEICFSKKVDPSIYHNWGKARMYYDMMHPDLCTDVEYVGFVDTDTFFATLVTPDLLFEDGKPVVVAKIGMEAFFCWPKLTEIFLGEKEVMQCMSSFPIMIKTTHMKEMREFLSKKHDKSFDLIFRDSARKAGKMKCMCQFSIMCNYLWYHHRDEYSWHLQMVPDGNWSGQNWLPSQVPVDYYHNTIRPEMKVPIPRVSVHLRYSCTNGTYLREKYPAEHFIEAFIKEGICYSYGFDNCDGKCKQFSQNAVHFNLYSFECYEWFWDKRCLFEQVKHYRKVKDIVRYYVDNKIGLFGKDNSKNVCSVL